MIHYQLCCDADHQFDGWFKDSANFENQAERGLIGCPVCASVNVRRALMAPGIRAKGRPAAPVIAETGAAVAPPTESPARPAMPAQLRAVLSKIRAEVEKNCDYVGPQFAEEARKIHNGEAPARGIYGESTQDETEALAEDGIGFAQIPWVPKADS